MHWIVFVLSSVVLVVARPRSGTSHDFGLESHESRMGFGKQQNEILWSPRYQRDLFEILSRLEAKRDTSQPKIARKRALSALARWKPLGSLVTRVKPPVRVPSRAPMISMLPDLNMLMSAESSEANRPMGQPLRWGKKR